MSWLSVPKTRKRGIHSRKRNGEGSWREFVWPTMGWKAFLVYAILKLKRSVSEPHHLAMGVAIGMWANFLPLPGMGGSLSLLLAWLFSASMVGAFAGQTLGNAWTMPFIWMLCYKVGLMVMPLNEHAIGFRMLMQNFNVSFIMANWEVIAKSVLLPLTVGGQILAIPISIATYWFVYVEMKDFKEFRRKLRDEKTARREAAKQRLLAS